MIKRFFKWVFSEEITALNRQMEQCNDVRCSLGVQEEILKERISDLHILENSLKKNLGRLDDAIRTYEVDASVDVHVSSYSRSWAVISLQGHKSDFVKFVDLGHSDMNEIQRFLSRYDRTKVDASPQMTGFLKMGRKRF